MKKMILMALIALLPLAAGAHEPEKKERRFDPERFQKMMEESITKTAALTSEEAKLLFPIFQEMKARQREISGQIRKLKKEAVANKSFAEAIGTVNDLKVEMAEVEREYYQRILKVLPAEKVFKVMKADDDFHRRMVQGQRDKRPHDGQRPPHGPRPHEDK